MKIGRCECGLFFNRPAPAPPTCDRRPFDDKAGVRQTPPAADYDSVGGGGREQGSGDRVRASRGRLDAGGFSPGQVLPTDRHGPAAPANHRAPLSVTCTPPAFRMNEHEVGREIGSTLDLSSRSRDGDNTVTSSSSWPPRQQVAHTVLPFPRKLRIDKILSHSLIIGWIPPRLDADDMVDEYHVLVDGRLSTVVSGCKNKAVVEHIYHDQRSYRVSLCAVTERGRSDAEHCVIAFGRQPEVTSSTTTIDDFRVEHVTASAARVAWQPSSSNHAHGITVEELTGGDGGGHGRQQQRHIIVPTPLCSHVINGLKANSKYEAVVVSRMGRVDARSRPLRFTTPCCSPPEPPATICVDDQQLVQSVPASGPLLLVTWVPVVVCDHDALREKQGGLTGYVVYCNGFEVAAVGGAGTGQCEVPVAQLAGAVRRFRAAAARMRKAASAAPTPASDSPFSDALPSVGVAVRSVTGDGMKSAASGVVHLRKAAVRAIEQGRDDAPSPSIRSSAATTSDDEESTATSRHHRVPAIEITQGTSSDDDDDVRSDDDVIRPAPFDAAAARYSDDGLSESSQDSRASSSVENRESSGRRRSRQQLPASAPPYYGWADGAGDQRRRSPQPAPISHHRKRRGTASSRGTDRSDGSDTSWHSSEKMSPRSGSVKLVNGRHHAAEKSVNGSDHVMSSAAAGDKWNGTPEKVSERATMIGDDVTVSLVVAMYNYDPASMSPNDDCYDDELPFISGQLLKVFGYPGEDGFYLGEDQNGHQGYIPSNMVSPIRVDDERMLEELFKRVDFTPSHAKSRDHRPIVTLDELFASNSSRRRRHQLADDVIDSSSPGGDHHDDRNGNNMFASKDDDDDDDDVIEEAAITPSRSTSSPRAVVTDDVIAGTGADGGEEEVRTFVALYDYDPKQSSPNPDAEVELRFRRGDQIRVYGLVDADGFYKGEARGCFGLVPCNFVQETTADPDDEEDMLSFPPPRSPSPPEYDPDEEEFVRGSNKSGGAGRRRSRSQERVWQHQEEEEGARGVPEDRRSSGSSSYHSGSVKRKGFLSKGKKLLRRFGDAKSKK